MALIKCPECGREVSDKAKSCPSCGYPIEIAEIEEKQKVLHKIPEYPYTICPQCGAYNRTGVFICTKCRHRYDSNEYKVLLPSDNLEQKEITKNEFEGIYRYDFKGKQHEVYCPQCKSHDCSHYTERNIIPAKSKTRYSVNLNPLRPFTIFNKKEKIVKKEQIEESKMFVCNKCGNKFF